jgi:hypothetical protein
MTVPSAEQLNEALALVLKLAEARGDKPSDPKIWSCLILTGGCGFSATVSRALVR